MRKAYLNKHSIALVGMCWLALLPGHRGAVAQPAELVRWLTFDQLQDSLSVRPKPVFVDFYADWCRACIQMQKGTFRDSMVAAVLNHEYYAVRMNVESKDTIYFGNQQFVNERMKKPNPVHQIPLMMASQKGKPFSLPAMILLDEKFVAKARYFQYLDAKSLLGILHD